MSTVRCLLQEDLVTFFRDMYTERDAAAVATSIDSSPPGTPTTGATRRPSLKIADAPLPIFPDQGPTSPLVASPLGLDSTADVFVHLTSDGVGGDTVDGASGPAGGADDGAMNGANGAGKGGGAPIPQTPAQSDSIRTSLPDITESDTDADPLKSDAQSDAPTHPTLAPDSPPALVPPHNGGPVVKSPDALPGSPAPSLPSPPASRPESPAKFATPERGGTPTSRAASPAGLLGSPRSASASPRSVSASSPCGDPSALPAVLRVEWVKVLPSKAWVNEARAFFRMINEGWVRPVQASLRSC